MPHWPEQLNGGIEPLMVKRGAMIEPLDDWGDPRSVTKSLSHQAASVKKSDKHGRGAYLCNGRECRGQASRLVWRLKDAHRVTEGDLKKNKN